MGTTETGGIGAGRSGPSARLPADERAARFGEWLRHQLRRMRWTQAELARRTGADTGSVSNWANGQRVPNPAWCVKLADALHRPTLAVLAVAGWQVPATLVEAEEPAAEMMRIAGTVNWTPARRGAFLGMVEVWRQQDATS